MFSQILRKFLLVLILGANKNCIYKSFLVKQATNELDPVEMVEHLREGTGSKGQVLYYTISLNFYVLGGKKKIRQITY